LSNLTASQRDAFVQGSIWANGLDKRTTHHTSHVVEKLRQINDAACDLHCSSLAMRRLWGTLNKAVDGIQDRGREEMHIS
jgi:hypothetical protein